MYTPDRIKVGEVVRIVFPPPHILSRCSTLFEAGRTSLIIRNNYTTRVGNVGASGESESRIAVGRVFSCNCASRGCSCREMQFRGRTRVRVLTAGPGRGKAGLKKESHSVGA